MMPSFVWFGLDAVRAPAALDEAAVSDAAEVLDEAALSDAAEALELDFSDSAELPSMLVRSLDSFFILSESVSISL